MNQVKLTGNLGKDAEIKCFESGARKTNFSLATTERYTNRRGENVTETQWHNISFWGKNFENLENLLKKGTSVSVLGKISYNRYTDKEGKTRYITEIIAQEVQLVEKTQPSVAAPVSPATGTDHLPF